MRQAERLFALARTFTGLLSNVGVGRRIRRFRRRFARLGYALPLFGFRRGVGLLARFLTRFTVNDRLGNLFQRARNLRFRSRVGGLGRLCVLLRFFDGFFYIRLGKPALAFKLSKDILKLLRKT